MRLQAYLAFFPTLEKRFSSQPGQKLSATLLFLEGVIGNALVEERPGAEKDTTQYG